MADYTMPTLLQERVEIEAEDIIHRQRAAEDAWQKFVARTITEGRRILADMPLGCPVPGYDADSIEALMWDWMQIAADPNEAVRAYEMSQQKMVRN